MPGQQSTKAQTTKKSLKKAAEFPNPQPTRIDGLFTTAKDWFRELRAWDEELEGIIHTGDLTRHWWTIY